MFLRNMAFFLCFLQCSPAIYGMMRGSDMNTGANRHVEGAP